MQQADDIENQVPNKDDKSPEARKSINENDQSQLTLGNDEVQAEKSLLERSGAHCDIEVDLSVYNRLQKQVQNAANASFGRDDSHIFQNSFEQAGIDISKPVN